MAPSRGLLVYRLSLTLRCCRPISARGIVQRRTFTRSSMVHSGHNRWSKIKHDKAKADAGKTKQRSQFATEIATTSKLYGPDPMLNTRLADIIAKAKKEGFPKASIEAAIARGQGRSAAGASLENLTVEGMLSTGDGQQVAVIIECETDNRLRTLAAVKLALKEAEGAATPCAYLFEKRGKIVFRPKEGVGLDEALDAALDAGATDVDQQEDGAVVVFSESGSTTAVGEAVASSLGLEITSSGIIWLPNEDTMVDVKDDEVTHRLSDFVDDLQDRESSVQAVAMNLRSI